MTFNHHKHTVAAVALTLLLLGVLLLCGCAGKGGESPLSRDNIGAAFESLGIAKPRSVAAPQPIRTNSLTLTWDVWPTNGDGLLVWLCGPGRPVRTQEWTVQASVDLQVWSDVLTTNRPPVVVWSTNRAQFYRLRVEVL